MGHSGKIKSQIPANHETIKLNLIQLNSTILIRSESPTYNFNWMMKIIEFDVRTIYEDINSVYETDSYLSDNKMSQAYTAQFSANPELLKSSYNFLLRQSSLKLKNVNSLSINIFTWPARLNVTFLYLICFLATLLCIITCIFKCSSRLLSLTKKPCKWVYKKICKDNITGQILSERSLSSRSESIIVVNEEEIGQVQVEKQLKMEMRNFIKD